MLRYRQVSYLCGIRGGLPPIEAAGESKRSDSGPAPRDELAPERGDLVGRVGVAPKEGFTQV